MAGVLLKVSYSGIYPTLLTSHFPLATRRFYVNEVMGTTGACEEGLDSCVLYYIKGGLIQFTAAGKPLCNI